MEFQSGVFYVLFVKNRQKKEKKVAYFRKY